MSKIREIVEGFDVESIILDGMRFSSLGSGLEAFSTCFCEYYKEKAEEFGLSHERMKVAVTNMIKFFYDFREAKEVLEAYNYSQRKRDACINSKKRIFNG